MKKGDTVWGGAPGQGSFYTPQSTMDVAGSDATKIFQGLQVGKGGHPSYRPGMTKYTVKKDVDVGYGRALANPQHGPGGMEQYYIEDFSDVLEPDYTVLLSNT